MLNFFSGEKKPEAPSPEKQRPMNFDTTTTTTSDAAPKSPAAASSSGEAKLEYDKQGNPIFVKQQIAYYKKNDATEKILVKVVGVHHDDFPNIYYTIQPCDPSSATFDEKQTDANRLSIVKDKDVEQPSPNPPSPSPAAVPINNNCIILNISHNKKDIPIRIDPKSTVLQLKEEISTKTGVAIKEMKLTSKGTVMKDNQVSISKSDLVHNSKIVLTKAKAR